MRGRLKSSSVVERFWAELRSLELSDEVEPFATREGVRFAGVPASSVGDREKGVLGRTEKETWEGRERERGI